MNYRFAVFFSVLILLVSYESRARSSQPEVIDDTSKISSLPADEYEQLHSRYEDLRTKLILRGDVPIEVAEQQLNHFLTEHSIQAATMLLKIDSGEIRTLSKDTEFNYGLIGRDLDSDLLIALSEAPFKPKIDFCLTALESKKLSRLKKLQVASLLEIFASGEDRMNADQTTRILDLMAAETTDRDIRRSVYRISSYVSNLNPNKIFIEKFLIACKKIFFDKSNDFDLRAKTLYSLATFLSERDESFEQCLLQFLEEPKFNNYSDQVYLISGYIDRVHAASLRGELKKRYCDTLLDAHIRRTFLKVDVYTKGFGEIENLNVFLNSDDVLFQTAGAYRINLEIDRDHAELPWSFARRLFDLLESPDPYLLFSVSEALTKWTRKLTADVRTLIQFSETDYERLVKLVTQGDPASVEVAEAMIASFQSLNSDDLVEQRFEDSLIEALFSGLYFRTNFLDSGRMRWMKVFSEAGKRRVEDQIIRVLSQENDHLMSNDDYISANKVSGAFFYIGSDKSRKFLLDRLKISSRVPTVLQTSFLVQTLADGSRDFVNDLVDVLWDRQISRDGGAYLSFDRPDILLNYVVFADPGLDPWVKIIQQRLVEKVASVFSDQRSMTFEQLARINSYFSPLFVRMPLDESKLGLKVLNWIKASDWTPDERNHAIESFSWLFLNCLNDREVILVLEELRLPDALIKTFPRLKMNLEASRRFQENYRLQNWNAQLTAYEALTMMVTDLSADQIKFLVDFKPPGSGENSPPVLPSRDALIGWGYSSYNYLHELSQIQNAQRWKFSPDFVEAIVDLIEFHSRPLNDLNEVLGEKLFQDVLAGSGFHSQRIRVEIIETLKNLTMTLNPEPRDRSLAHAFSSAINNNIEKFSAAQMVEVKSILIAYWKNERLSLGDEENVAQIIAKLIKRDPEFEHELKNIQDEAVTILKDSLTTTR